MSYYVYVLHSGNRTYTGCTNNPVRRLRQHCGIIKGGAKSTSGRSDWRYLTLTSCESWTQIRALQVEHKFKYPNGKRKVPAVYRGPQGRMTALKEICKRVPDSMTMQVCDEFIAFAQNLHLPDHVTIVPMQSQCAASQLCIDRLTFNNVSILPDIIQEAHD
jgi:predicted GIY-YIG superfamily endonuclease